ncbi:MAG: hypothetical protein GY720_07210 [bacterium]|nr:hypothetical protein [bacterium]
MRGGATTALIGLTAAFGVGLYLNTAGTTGTLGALGGIAILLFFFNLMWFVYLYGAEVTKVYTDYLRYGDVMQPTERERLQLAQGFVRPERDGDAMPEQISASRSFLTGAAFGWLLGRGGRGHR